MPSATAARAAAGVATLAGWCATAPTMAARLEECTGIDSPKTAMRMAGSASAAIIVSRLAPMPPNAVPVSSPASARATVPSSSRPTTAKRSPALSNGEPVVTPGTMTAMTRVLAAIRTGAAVKMIVVPSGRMRCFRSSFRRSRHGCRTPLPARPSSLARTWRVIPTTIGAPAATRTSCRAAPVAPPTVSALIGQPRA